MRNAITENFRFDEQTVAITGAAVGLGKAYAELLGELGATLVLNDLSPAVEDVASTIRANGGRAEAVIGSVADAATADAIVERAMTISGHIDAIINNAGIGLQRPFADCDTADFQRLLDIHYFGTLHLTRAAWPHMVQAGYGRVVNVVSSSMFGFEGWSAYAAAKGAIFGLTRTLALEAAPLGIRVNMLSPGAATPMLFANNDDPEIVRWMSQTMPPEAVAPGAAWLVHPDCDLNGVVVGISGAHLTQMQIGSAIGVMLSDRRIESVAAAVRDPNFARGFVAESSVVSGIARRAALPPAFDRPTVARHAFEALSRLDIDAMVALFAPDAAFELPFAPAGIPNRIDGRDAIAQFLKTSLADLKTLAVDIVSLHDCPDSETVIVEWESDARRRDGSVYANQYVQVIRFRGAEIALWKEYFNPGNLS
jgi:NAD(P)-dependent dehydrogenase (short-subunit alcohol dehydrogenase family)/ketosteroid isomerase-like protein